MTSLSSRSAPSDAELVRASRAGEKPAFEALVRRHQNLVTGVAYSVLGEHRAAEEVAQDAFIAAWQQLHQLKDPTRLRAWLAGMTRRMALNRRRVSARAAQRPGVAADDEAAATVAPDVQAIEREEEAIVNQALSALPEDFREALVLYYREEHSTAAVAEALEISEDAVRQRLARGRRLLQQRVFEQIERTLRRTAPGAALVVAVLALLPPTPAADSQSLWRRAWWAVWRAEPLGHSSAAGERRSARRWAPSARGSACELPLRRRATNASETSSSEARGRSVCSRSDSPARCASALSIFTRSNGCIPGSESAGSSCWGRDTRSFSPS
ncbi:MAG TPA: sigma-70 family RNA polymerase sigma factor [Opitutaceae bacterium]|nr:sigma-70 family RNA polymerase sigma factor [Opitutaceae bacterium]